MVEQPLWGIYKQLIDRSIQRIDSRIRNIGSLQKPDIYHIIHPVIVLVLFRGWLAVCPIHNKKDRVMDLQPKEMDVYIHSGVVSAIRDRSIIVSLDQNNNCDSCHARGGCGIADSATREVEVGDLDRSFTLHEEVQVTLKKGLGQKAVFWAYIFPFSLMLLTLVVASMATEEWVAGLMSLLILIPYYGILYLFRSHFQKTFRITVLKI
jgi:sigma-E factor negative regulatory protein RseC